jgi:hypothetical protein
VAEGKGLRAGHGVCAVNISRYHNDLAKIKAPILESAAKPEDYTRRGSARMFLIYPTKTFA